MFLFGGGFFVSHLLQYIGAVSGAVAGLGIISAAFVKIWQGIRRLFRLLDAIDNKTKELEHNGGGSMKDGTKAMLETQELLKANQDQMMKTQGTMLEVQKQTVERLDRLERHSRFFNWGPRGVR